MYQFETLKFQPLEPDKRSLIYADGPNACSGTPLLREMLTEPWLSGASECEEVGNAELGVGNRAAHLEDKLLPYHRFTGAPSQLLAPPGFSILSTRRTIDGSERRDPAGR